jgi:porin
VFLHSSHGIGAELSQTGENGPSIFPVSSIALRAAMRTDSFIARVAVMDAVPGDPDDSASNKIELNSDDGYLTIVELDVPIMESARLWAGYWRYSAEFEKPFGMGSSSDNDGWYVGGEYEFQMGSRSAAWFVRFGRADERLNKLKYYVGFGLVADGLFVSRPDDRFGIAVASAYAGDPYRNYLDQIGAGAERRETAWEITYRAQINEHLVLQPDIQYVQNPSVSMDLRDALVFGIRFEITY